LLKNPLHEIDPRLSALTELNRLWLEDTGLSALPPQLKDLTKLTHLYLHGRNRFASIPEVIFKLKALTSLDLGSNSEAYSNRISEVPRQIIELPGLELLQLEGNPIQSPLPRSSSEAFRRYESISLKLADQERHLYSRLNYQ
jgi:internalin A